ncbi:MAG TPA: extracellular solute-binding protein, partial [Thermomicrobiales bacterium]|nr:extracellular solute-binding protein [Thermomicrobiales bacterium]
MSQIRTTRRDVIRAGAAAGAIAGATALGARGASAAGRTAAHPALLAQDTVELTWAINAVSGTEIDLVQKVVDSFIAKNPNYKVSVLNYDPETYDQKLLTDISAGTMPDMFVSADVFTKPFFDSGLTADLNPLAAETGFDLTEFDEKFLALGEYEGKLGFLPRAADVVVTYYNKEMFDTAGVPYPSEDWTYQDM